jgi:DNA-binding NarL/FixJ family response regulator
MSLEPKSYIPAMKSGPGMDRLTPREREILGLLAKGFRYKEIGGQLGISASTVRAHLHSIYSKLEVGSRTEAVLRFLGRQ